MGPLPPDQIAVVQKTRNILTAGRKASITDIQRVAAIDDPNIVWPPSVSKTVLPAPNDKEDTVVDLVSRAIEELRSGDNHFTAPSVINIDARWTGREPESTDALPSSMSEQEKYLNITKSATDPLTILFFHGGGF
ncbi:MAG: hypothetical protein MMC33_006023 [Icmadophila ericetorum]|nr:hypothetical protein [Icmadophila ericetorum]